MQIDLIKRLVEISVWLTCDLRGMDCELFIYYKVSNNFSQRSSIGAVGVRLCSSARLAIPLELMNLNLPDFLKD